MTHSSVPVEMSTVELTVTSTGALASGGCSSSRTLVDAIKYPEYAHVMLSVEPCT